MRAILYARYSTERQTEASIDDQLRVCREYAAARGWTVAGEHADEGISGAALGNRRGVRDALAALQREDVLLLTDLSRLSRSQDLAPLLTRLRHRGVRVIGIQDGFDSDSRTARMQAGLSGILSEEYRAQIASRTHSALELRARERRATGGRAYDDVEVLREIFARFAGGETMKAIAGDLNRRGIPSPGATWNRSRPRGRWLVSALHAILHNERYAGRLVWNRSQWIRDPDTGRRLRRERPRSEWVVSDIEPVIDEVTWQRVQERFRANGGGRGGARRYLLSGILECGLCGAKLIVVGGSQHRYVCGTYHGGGEHACANDRSVPRAIAEDGILRPVMDELLSAEGIKVGMEALRDARREAERQPHPARAEVRELERLVREGILSRETAAPALNQARRHLDEALDLPWPSEKLWRESVEGMREILEGEDVGASREVLAGLLGTIRCRPAEEPGFVVAELAAWRTVMAVGGRSGRWVGSGGLHRIWLPTSSRLRDTTI